MKIAILLIAIVILLICYTTLDLTFTLLVAIAMGIIAGIWFLLTRRRGKKERR